MDTEFDGKAFCKTVARLPGVYVMLGRSSDCLYVGKAKHLRNRLASYFVSTPQSGKIQRMLSRVASIQVHITKTESEALLLENTLIKEHRPRYNILLRDDKSYPYIRLSDNHDYPGLSLYRGVWRRRTSITAHFPVQRLSGKLCRNYRKSYRFANARIAISEIGVARAFSTR